MKKFFSILLALVMVLSLSVTAFADDEVTITVPDNGHTYKYYQIFTGDVEGNQLTNIRWGDDGRGTPGSGVDAATLTAVTAITGTNSVKGDAIKAYTSGDGHPITGTSVSVVPGYYLIEDASDVQGQDDFVSLYVVKVCNTLTISPKGDKPSVEKKVKDVDDTTGAQTGWQDSADYDFGDTVPFQLTATMPNSFDGYDTYKIVFHDTLSTGLSYKDIVSVKVNDVEKTDNFTVNQSGQNLTISCDDVLALGATVNSKIVVEYNATLTTGAQIGSAGNPNTVYLEYSNNPYSSGTGQTPEDKVIVFTYKVVVDKVDESNTPLVGAGFTLYKKNASGNYVPVGTEVKGTNLTHFTWLGLDDGEYKLEESTVPANYNKMADQFFAVVAQHDVNSANPQLTDLTGNVTTGEISFAKSVPDGSLSAKVVNHSGAELPETGGIGTTIFYIAGSLLVAAAAVLLITRKRMSSRG